MPVKKASSSRKKARKEITGYCPTCGQRIKPEPFSERAKLALRTLKEKDLTQAELGRMIGRSPQAVNFFFTGSQGTSDRPYMGRKSPGKGQTPIGILIKNALAIPDDKWAAAGLADEIKIAQSWNRCSKTLAPMQEKHIHRRSLSGRVHPLEAKGAA